MARFKNFVTTNSLVNPSFNIDSSMTVISVVRKPNTDSPEHAFIIVEGINESNLMFIRRYDLVLDNQREGYSTIISKEIIGSPAEIKNKFYQMVFRSQAENNELFGKSWNVSFNLAKTLDHNIELDKKNPPKYNNSGANSILGYSSSHVGHSCFTWCREKINQLNQENAKMLINFTDIIASVPSWHLDSPVSGRGGR